MPILAERGEFSQAIGISRGGRTTNIQCLADAGDRIVALALIATVTQWVAAENLGDRMVGVTGIEPVTPTMST